MAINIYLDDMRVCPDDTWTVASTVKEAWELLCSNEVEHMSLDHDLGENEPTGKALVIMMIEGGRWPKNKPTVHSQNPYGRYVMIDLIERYGPYRSEP